MEWQECKWHPIDYGKDAKFVTIDKCAALDDGDCLKDKCPLVILFKRTTPLDVVDLLGYVEEVDGNLADLNEKIEQQGKEIAELRTRIDLWLVKGE